MFIPSKQWEKTELGKAIYMFPGEVGQLFQKTTPASLLRAEKFLPFILWRWYFLKQENEQATPYMLLDFYRTIEHWPKQGQFFPTAHIVYKKRAVDFSITLEYISFDQQPMIQDVNNALQNKPCQFNFGYTYQRHIDNIVKVLKTKNPSSAVILDLYLDRLLYDWYVSTELTKEAFGSFDTWAAYWKRILNSITKTQYYDTSHILDSYVKHMRKTFPDFGLLNEELHEGMKKQDQRALESFHFWSAFIDYLVIPFSLYCNLLAPVFTDRKNFFEDVQESIDREYTNPDPLLGPCTFLSVTPFGKIAQAKLWQ